MAWIGEHSLEVYLAHYLLLSLIKLENNPSFYSPMGLTLVLVNYLLTVLLVVLIIVAINKNKTLRVVLTGKKG